MTQRLDIRVRDGLRLHVAHWPAATPTGRRPVLCLAGLTRNSRDFGDLAQALSTDRTVYALDYRGRGLSDWDSNWRNYAIPVEAQDVVDVVAALGLAEPAIVGTSRGGLVAMVLAALQPASVGPVVLNDIGPVIEMRGLTRIAGYVGRTPVPATWDDAARTVEAAHRKAFPSVPIPHWADVARQLYNDKDGRPAAGFDPALARSLSVKDGPAPALWPQFLAFAARPVLVVRGETSDLLSPETVTEMTRRLPNCQALTVPGEGHAPLLKDAPTIGAIRAFLDGADAGSHKARALGAASHA